MKMETADSTLNKKYDLAKSNSSASEEKNPLLDNFLTNSDSNTTPAQDVESRREPSSHETRRIDADESDSETEHFEDAMDALELGSSKGESGATENENEFVCDELLTENSGDETIDDSSENIINEDVIREQEARLTEEEKQVAICFDMFCEWQVM